MARPTTPCNAYRSILLMPREPTSRIVQDEETAGSLPYSPKLLEVVVFLGSTVLASKGRRPFVDAATWYVAASLLAPPPPRKVKAGAAAASRIIPMTIRASNFFFMRSSFPQRRNSSAPPCCPTQPP